MREESIFAVVCLTVKVVSKWYHLSLPQDLLSTCIYCCIRRKLYTFVDCQVHRGLGMDLQILTSKFLKVQCLTIWRVHKAEDVQEISD